MTHDLDTRCEICLEDTAYDELEYGICMQCRDEILNDRELMLSYAEKNEKEFYAEWCYGAQGDYYPELTALCKREMQRDISLEKPYALKYLCDFCKEDLSDYIDFCRKELNK